MDIQNVSVVWVCDNTFYNNIFNTILETLQRNT